MNQSGVEIERKFLIELPKEEFLRSCSVSDIEQIYLLPEEEGSTERVRRRAFPEKIEYTHTIKRHISEIKRREDEVYIAEDEYRILKKRADPSRKPIRKTRYCYSWQGHLLEIDVYPFWKHQCVLEIELEREDEAIDIPPVLRMIREVTSDRNYSNAALSLLIPKEETEL